MSIAVNKKAYFDYEILESYEAGIVLSGQEVKSVKNNQINLKGAYVTLKDGEAYLTNAHISLYKKAGALKDYSPERPRKLLLHKKELKHLIGKSQEKGLTIIPLKVYTKGRGKIKIEIGIGRGKKKYEKRETTKKREVEREMREKMKSKI
ncbi:MAG: SsrA-binding protein SmpB [Parcubacteria group bacterium]|nr:SsrA-binding protein SmpB [Parcubacteria group bacterium]